MKNLFIVGGTMGVGKTTVCEMLNKKLKNSVFLDGDNCWNMSPFTVNDETKKMVIDNICYLLNNFIKATAFENIVFCWVLHEQNIIDDIISKLIPSDLSIVCISLLASADILKSRLQNDIDRSLRSPDIIERSVSRLPLYENLNTIKINTDNLTVDKVVNEIIKIKEHTK